MGTLYSGAEEVIIWLGEADKTTDEIVHVIHERYFPVVPATDAENDKESWLRYRSEIARMMFLLVIIGLRPWWSRVWTLQECVLAQNDTIFRCGFHTFSWQDFFDVAIRILENVQQILPSLQAIMQNNPSIKEMLLLKFRLSEDAGDPEDQQIFGGMLSMESFRRRWRVAHNLSPASAMIFTLGRQASVPHDYIYGTLGLATSEGKDKIGMEYRSSFWLVYRKFFKMMLTHTPGPQELKSLTLISFYKETDEQPSWLPDFSKQKDVSKHTGIVLDSETPFQSLEKMHWSDGDEILNLKGICLDVVDQVYDIQMDEDNYIDRMMALATNVRKATTAKLEALPSSSPLRELVEVAQTAHISHLFLDNVQIDDDKEMSDTLIRTSWDKVAGYYNSDVPPSFDSVDSEVRGAKPSNVPFEITVQVFPQALVVCKGRSLVISRAGIPGLCVPNVWPGDGIVCFYGLNMPFILRPQRGHYRFIGGIRLLGLADWVVLTECQKNGHLHEATFHIG
jgi:hypothetical protein